MASIGRGKMIKRIGVESEGKTPVAFLDILGFSDMITSGGAEQETAARTE